MYRVMPVRYGDLQGCLTGMMMERFRWSVVELRAPLEMGYEGEFE